MGQLFKHIKTFYTLTRSYSLPISIMSWTIPFIFASFNKGSILYGLIALIGIIIMHTASNLFDDIVDYYFEKRLIDKGLKTNFNFQSGKCICILTGLVSFKKAVIIDLILFLSAGLIGAFFIYIWGLNLLYILIPAAILSLLYPVLGCLGLGEIIIALIFSPFLYSGVYFVMTGGFSYDILILSVSTGLLTVAVLHNHMLLDYKFDKSNRKITLCTISGNKENAFTLLVIFVSCAYLNIITFVLSGKLGCFYLLTLLSIPFAAKLFKVMKDHIKSDTVCNKEDFLKKFMLVQNLLTVFTILLCISIISDKIIKICT